MSLLTKVFVIFLAICLSSVFSLPNRSRLRRPRLDPGRIVGGKPADIEEFPYQVSLQYMGYHMCGGSIISENYILTASHCTADLQEFRLSVRMGSAEHGSGGIVMPIETIINHPKFDMDTVDYDYSLLKLSHNITFNEKIQAVELPEKNEIIEDGAECAVSGWGETKSASESNHLLRATVIPKVNHDECSQSYKYYGGISPRMMCAGYTSGGHDACQGDSGGPLVSDNILVGIVSWGFGCAKPNYPGVYADVAAVRDWIKKESGV